MRTLLEVGLANALVAGLLAVAAVAAGRWSRRPALVHGLWLLVLVKLLTPPLVPLPLPWLPVFLARPFRAPPWVLLFLLPPPPPPPPPPPGRARPPPPPRPRRATPRTRANRPRRSRCAYGPPPAGNVRRGARRLGS